MPVEKLLDIEASLPRVPIETTFKKVREFLFAKTSGKQIPWEHTSFVGEFYFNPDTIYDGVAYSMKLTAIIDLVLVRIVKLKE